MLVVVLDLLQDFKFPTMKQLLTVVKNILNQDRIINFCMPTDETMKHELLTNAELEEKYIFINSIDTVFLCCFLALGLSIIYAILAHCFPKFMNTAAVYVGIIFTLGLTICFFTYNSSSPMKIPLAICFLIIFILLVFNLIVNKKTFEMHGVYLEAASKMLGD